MSKTRSKIEILLTAKDTGLQAGLNKAATQVQRFSAGLGGLRTAMVGLVAGGASFYALNSLIRESVQLAGVQEQAETKLAAVLKATGEAAGFKIAQLKQMASEMQGLTTTGDEVILDAMAVLATFKEIKGDNFKQATMAALDMATVLGGDLQQSILQVGKALNDPVRGMTALSRSGVSFSEAQRQAVKDMVAMGDSAGAQALILKELQSEFGGAAAALRKDFSGSVTAAGNALGDLKEEIGFAITKNPFFIELVGKLESKFVQMTESVAANRGQWMLWAEQVGGGLVRVGEAVWSAAEATGRFISAHGSTIALVAKWTAGLWLTVKAAGALAGAWLGLQKVMASTMVLNMVGWLQGIQAASVGVVASLTGLQVGLAGLAAAGAAFFAAYRIGEWLTMRDSIAQVAAAKEELARATDKVSAKLREISADTGVTVRSMEELDQAVRDGRIHFDELASTWKAGSAEQAAAARQTAQTMKQATGEALAEMQKKYREYAAEVRRLQGEIVGRERSLAAELRALARTGMSDVSAWQDQKREAEEYAEAAKRTAAEAEAALKAGDTITAGEKWKEAVSYADEAKQAYKALNTEVKSGDQVIISQQQALQTAMDGVKQAGEIGIGILKRQQEAAKGMMDDLVGASGFADLTEGMNDAEKIWLQNWQNMEQAAERNIETVRRRLDALVEDRHVTVWVTEKVKKATGGLIRRMATGGKLPGYGGGDRISALLEAGEFVVRKEAVSKFGAGLFHALNSLRLPEIPRFAAGGPVSPAEIHALDIHLGGSYAGRLSGSPVDVRAIRKAFQRADRLRSA